METATSVFQRIQKTQFIHHGYNTTVCVLTLDNGFAVVGQSICDGDDPEALGLAEEYARADALTKLDPIHEFLLRENAS